MQKCFSFIKAAVGAKVSTLKMILFVGRWECGEFPRRSGLDYVVVALMKNSGWTVRERQTDCNCGPNACTLLMRNESGGFVFLKTLQTYLGFSHLWPCSTAEVFDIFSRHITRTRPFALVQFLDHNDRFILLNFTFV